MASEVYLIDCMEYMKTVPDKWFDLAVVDPPYGIDAGNMNLGNGVGTKSRKWESSNWDKAIPEKEYFDELFRVSKNQIIWGANYFIEYLTNSTSMIIWDKMQEFSGADFELAWTSFNTPSKAFRLSRVQAYTNQVKIHPTQKPVAMYSWIYSKYLLQGGRVFDSHLGSGSNRIAADKAGNIDFYGTEIDREYYEAQERRWKDYKSQLVIDF